MMLPLEGSAGYEEKTTGTNTGSSEVEYNEDNIRHLDDMEHIRVRSGMYIGRLGDGSQNDDGMSAKDCSQQEEHSSGASPLSHGDMVSTNCGR